MRKTSRQLAALHAAEKIITPGSEPSLSLVSVGTDKGLKFIANVTIGANTYAFASDAGKVQTFSDVDAFVKKVSKFAESGDGAYTVTVDTGALLASTVPVNLVAAKAAKILSLGKIKTNQQAVLVGIDEQIAMMPGWDVGNAAQRAKLTETQAQREAVVGDIAELTAEIAALQA